MPSGREGQMFGKEIHQFFTCKRHINRMSLVYILISGVFPLNYFKSLRFKNELNSSLKAKIIDNHFSVFLNFKHYKLMVKFNKIRQAKRNYI